MLENEVLGKYFLYKEQNIYKRTRISTKQDFISNL